MERYGGKHLRITGFISDIGAGESSVSLEAEQFQYSEEAVLCLVANDEQLRRVDSLKLGQYVTVWGECSAGESEGFCVLIHCISP